MRFYTMRANVPKQEMTVAGGLLHTHTREPRLASLSNEALQELARKYDEVLANPRCGQGRVLGGSPTPTRPILPDWSCNQFRFPHLANLFHNAFHSVKTNSCAMLRDGPSEQK